MPGLVFMSAWREGAVAPARGWSAKLPRWGWPAPEGRAAASSGGWAQCLEPDSDPARLSWSRLSCKVICMYRRNYNK